MTITGSVYWTGMTRMLRMVATLSTVLPLSCQDSQISKPETPYFPKPPRPYLSLFFAILCDLSRFFAIPRYKDHESHEPSRPTLFIHFILLTSFSLSLSRLSGKHRDNKWMMI